VCRVDPVSVLRAVKSGPVPSAYTVLRSNPVYFERERPELFQCRTGAIIFALIWFVLIPGIDLIGSLFRDPLVSAVVYFIYWSVSLGMLALTFVFIPRIVAREIRQVLILTPDVSSWPTMSAGD